MGLTKRLRSDSERVRPDPERLAGAILELGILDLQQGRFADALDRGADLQTRRGRYAIPRWRGWGLWLAAVANMHLGDLDATARLLRDADDVFASDGHRRGQQDAVLAGLRCARVATARGSAAGADLPALDVRVLSPGQTDEARLILADLDIACGDSDRALQRLQHVLREPRNEVVRWWANLGLAELARLDGSGVSGFATVRDHASSVGARWLELQAVLGMVLSGELDQGVADRDLQREPPQLRGPVTTISDLMVGEPRVLWMAA